MTNAPEKSFERRILERLPGIRKVVCESVDFITWRDSLPSIFIEDEKLYIRGGDMLKDEDQIIFEWARKHDLLPDELISQVAHLKGDD